MGCVLRSKVHVAHLLFALNGRLRLSYQALTRDLFSDTQFNRSSPHLKILIKPHFLGAGIVYRWFLMVHDKNATKALDTCFGYPIPNTNLGTEVLIRI